MLWRNVTVHVTTTILAFAPFTLSQAALLFSLSAIHSRHFLILHLFTSPT